MSWPAEIDVFLAVGELALYVAYLDAWPARQRVWPWATALTGLAVSVAGNVGHIQAVPGDPVSRDRPADRRDQPARRVRGPVRRAAGGEDDPPARGPAGARAATLMLAPPPPPGVVLIRPDPSAEPRTPGRILACSATRPSFSRTHPPVASASASGLSPGSSAAMATISPTITCARSRKPSGWPATWPPEQPVTCEEGEDMPQTQPIQARLRDASAPGGHAGGELRRVRGHQARRPQLHRPDPRTVRGVHDHRGRGRGWPRGHHRRPVPARLARPARSRASWPRAAAVDEALDILADLGRCWTAASPRPRQPPRPPVIAPPASEAADAARRIHQLMARGDDAPRSSVTSSTQRARRMSPPPCPSRRTARRSQRRGDPATGPPGHHPGPLPG